MPKVVVTGGSGMLGKWVVKHFVEQGYEVLNADVKHPAEPISRTVIVDLNNLGEVYGILAGADAVVHLAAIPVAYSHPNEVTFHNNVMSTYNVLEAAAGLGIRKAVIASSESSYGLVFAEHSIGPQYVPVDEAHPQLPQDSYGLSKIVNEQTADMFNRRTGMQVVSFRLGNVISPEAYERFPQFIHDPEQRERILWSYIDTRDAAQAFQLAIEADGLGSIALNLAADDSSMAIPSRELMSARYPEVNDFRKPLEGHESLLSNEKAKALLNWQPKHAWRSYVKQ
ncbi:NAD-dependent epimerase/dehydratase family protein [Paenibacillus radicis (ex Gao et al. 2016)]|uniref:Nucleoside-diphosphate-sugar epimerase n=1 Tax=Paenibacillus radicis (ex Gao et al. 2016) TaxID=1737354 RepID=A0A917H139_9BACL|nr:NAD(P)-dependent oxidoreductase [Paenibacillus radicis (ex Gao et al. 2016)]GGG64204.1 nucleoside-diphosphate-sugar epimerase [Paenibacillus radicis (ex Gao et al. 2016)]